MTDRLDLANAFENAGIERRAAERLADEVFSAIRENVATKTDVEMMRTEIRESELRLRAEIGTVRTEIERVRAELVKWVVGTGIAAVLAIVGLLKLMVH